MGVGWATPMSQGVGIILHMKPQPFSADQRAAMIASRQHGLMTYAEALGAGLSPNQARYRLRTGRWIAIGEGVFVVAGSPPGWRQSALAGCLLTDGRGVASHLTAAALHGWTTAPGLPDVTVGLKCSARTPHVTLHRSNVPPQDRVRVAGVPCTSASRTLVDLAAMVERLRLEVLVDDAFCSGSASPESVRASLNRAGRRGRTGAWLLPTVVRIWSEDIKPGSPAEVRFLRRLEELGVRGAATQHEVRDAAGRVVGRLDVALPDRRHGFDYDSDRFHGPRRWDHDENRHSALVALGWWIDHVSKRDLLPSATRIAGLLAQARPESRRSLCANP